MEPKVEGEGDNMPRRSTLTDLSDEQILRIARLRVTESAAATYTEGSLDTQLSVERGVIWLIHFIEWYPENLKLLNAVAAGGNEAINAQLTRESKSDILNPNDADLISLNKHQVARSSAIGTDAGPLWFNEHIPKRVEFPIPIPFASASLFMGIKGTSSSAHTVNARVGYTIRSVTDKFFFRVAQALLG